MTQDLTDSAGSSASPVVLGAMEPTTQQSMEPAMNVIQTAFLLARKGNFDQVLQLAESHSELWQVTEEDGDYSLLHWAALAGHKEFVQRALAASVLPDAIAANKQTPLMWATIKGHIATMRLLLDAKADALLRDSMGAAAIVLAIQHSQHAAFLFLSTRVPREQLYAAGDGNGCAALHWSAYKGDATCIKLLDYFDSSFDVVDGEKMTPLHRAVQNSQTGILELLIEKKVDPLKPNASGETVLDLAIKHKDAHLKRTLERLIEAQGINIAKAQAAENGSVVVNDGSHDLEAGEGVVSATKQAAQNKRSKDAEKFRGIRKAASSKGPPTFWLVCVSLCVFQYLMEVRSIAWEKASVCAFGFELGVFLSLALFFYTSLADPGTLPPRMKHASGVEELMKAFEAGDDEPGFDRLCTTTWVLKGLRTKYCVHTGACVEEFDHFCGWLGCAIGKANHRPFIFLAAAETTTQFCHLYLLWIAAFQLVEFTSFGFFVISIMTSHPLLGILAFVHTFTAPGVLFLLANQLSLIARNLTTNEMINAYRYQHFWDIQEQEGGGSRKQFKNPFHKGGAVGNCLDFWWRRERAEFGAPGTVPARLLKIGNRVM